MEHGNASIAPKADVNKPALRLNKGNMDLGLFCGRQSLGVRGRLQCVLLDESLNNIWIREGPS